ncbi:Cytochrome b-c1 complex subunit 9, mitochondrial [Thecaphora frezii]
MSVYNTIYQTVFKRNSVFVGTVFFGAFAFGIGYDVATQKWWDAHNHGKQWKDIRHKYLADSE